MTVCGADIIHSLQSKSLFRDGVVCVDRIASFDVQQVLKKHRFKDRIIFIEANDWKDQFSSTKVRTSLLEGQSIEGLTHPSVIQYIRYGSHSCSQ